MKNINQIKIGIVVAKPNCQKSELERFLTSSDTEIFLFPEAFLNSNNIGLACEIAKTNGKWLISGVDDIVGDKKFEKGIVINPKGEIIGEHIKTSITDCEVKNGYSQGDSIDVIETDFGKIGISICYEFHFPEISRIYALNGARIIFNPVGTGMWHEQQYQQWNSIASARASENRIFVVGCSHFNDGIPFAFAYAPNGECLVQSRDANRLVTVTLDFDKYYYMKKNFSHRRPELYNTLTEATRDSK